ncbi:MAG: hypothetical protein HYX92_08155 [Chloroflexi bacterium]|nr:hypothetical protein [Chloroflexota bacterium]
MVKLSSGRVDVPDSIEAIYEYALNKGWTDGFPIIPPTEARVAAMVQATGRDPREEIVRIPPRLGRATVEKIAINAVMAGCLPAYMPVIIAALEAMCAPEFNLNGIQATTNPVTPAIIINGPIRQKLGINCGAGCLGPGWRANATIGRAIRLLLLNVGGATPGDVDKAVHGQPGKYTLCFGEDEEGSVWEPLHVERGLEREESAVTVVSAAGTTNVNSSLTHSARDILMIIADVLSQLSSNDMKLGGGQPTVVVTAGHAALLKSQGYSKSDVKAFLFENSGVPLSQFPQEWAGRMWTKDGVAYPARCAGDIVIVVAGAPQPYHITCMTTFGTSRVQTVRVI